MLKYFVASIIFISTRLTGADLRFAVIGDRAGSHTDSVFEEIIGEVKLLTPDFVLNVGDLIEGYETDTMITKAQWEGILNTIRILPCPFHFVPGNHDIESEIDTGIFEKVSGTKHYYSFDVQNSHFIILDNTSLYWQTEGGLDSAQFAWLTTDLETSKSKDNSFAFFHIPTWSDSWNNAQADTVEALLERYGVKAVFTGHHHTYTYFEKNGTKYVTLSSSGGGLDDMDIGKGNLFSYLLVTVRGKEADIAVMKKGSVLEPDFFTLEDNTLVLKIFKEAFTFSPCLVRDETGKTAQVFKVTVKNFGPDSIKQTIKWKYNHKKYSIKPSAAPLAMASGEAKDVSFELAVFNGSNIYPLPQLTMVYPYKHEKACTVRINAGMIKRIAPVMRIQKPVVLDGILNDAAWTKIKPITDLTSSQYGSSGSAIDETQYYLAHDADNLYMAIRCFDKDLGKLKALATEHDGATYSDDNIWFFLDSDYDKETYYQAIINSNGAVYDRRCSLKDGVSTKDLEWNGPWEIRSGKEPNAWTLEIKIPKKGLAPFNEKQWGFAFRRLQPRLGDAGWQIPFGHDPSNFGIIEFK
ncbi:MAG TPA: metallophosphoesterase [bacterium]